MINQQNVVRALNAVTATTTSTAIPIKNAKKVTFVFKRSNHASGSTAFTVTVSADDSTYISYAKLIDNLINGITEGVTRIATKTLSSDTSVTLSMSPEDCFEYLKVTATETTDGTHDAWVIVQY